MTRLYYFFYHYYSRIMDFNGLLSHHRCIIIAHRMHHYLYTYIDHHKAGAELSPSPVYIISSFVSSEKLYTHCMSIYCKRSRHFWFLDR